MAHCYQGTKEHSKTYAFARLLLFRYAARIEAILVAQQANKRTATASSSKLVASDLQMSSTEACSIKQNPLPGDYKSTILAQPSKASDEDDQRLLNQSTLTKNDTGSGIVDQGGQRSSTVDDCKIEALDDASYEHTQEDVMKGEEGGR